MAFDYYSDNTAAVHPKIMAAIAACNEGYATPYGADEWSRQLNRVYSDLFEHETFVFPVSSGTAANGLAIGSAMPPYGTVFCHQQAHIVVAEGGSVEFYSGGGRLVLVGGEDCKLAASSIERVLAGYGPTFIQQMQASALTLTQATERGTLYSLDEIKSLTDIARRSGLKVHMDGARFANALVALGATPADMTWKSGIDVVSFGTTKNGAMMAEAVLVFDKALAEVIRFKHKRAGFLHSKMRYFSAQLLAYVEDGLWLENARKANATARRLADAFARAPGVSLIHPVETNQIFVDLPPEVVKRIETAGLKFRAWPDPKGRQHRLVASYMDQDDLVRRVEKALAASTS